MDETKRPVISFIDSLADLSGRPREEVRREIREELARPVVLAMTPDEYIDALADALGLPSANVRRMVDRRSPVP